MKIKWINLSKIFFLLYLAYTYIVRQSFFASPALSYILLIMAAACFLLYSRTIHLNAFLSALLIFFSYSFITSIVIAADKNTALTACKRLFEFIIIFWLTCEYSWKDKNTVFVRNVYILLALFYAVIVLLFGVGSKRISISETVNVNTIAQTMVFAIGFTLYRFTEEERTIFRTTVGIAQIVLFLYVIAVTVSKMAIICSVLVIVLWVLFCSVKTDRTIFIKKGLLILAAAAVGYFLIIYFKNHFSQEYEYLLLRMSLIKNGRSSVERFELIKEALNVFSEHPLFGVGLNNFRFYSRFSTYSHCFYSEIPACSGILGMLMLFTPMFLMFIGLINKIRIAPNEDRKRQASSILLIYIIFLILIFAQIYIYAYHLMFTLAIINATFYIDTSSE